MSIKLCGKCITIWMTLCFWNNVLYCLVMLFELTVVNKCCSTNSNFANDALNYVDLLIYAAYSIGLLAFINCASTALTVGLHSINYLRPFRYHVVAYMFG